MAPDTLAIDRRRSASESAPAWHQAHAWESRPLCDLNRKRKAQGWNVARTASPRCCKACRAAWAWWESECLLEVCRPLMAAGWLAYAGVVKPDNPASVPQVKAVRSAFLKALQKGCRAGGVEVFIVGAAEVGPERFKLHDHVTILASGPIDDKLFDNAYAAARRITPVRGSCSPAEDMEDALRYSLKAGDRHRDKPILLHATGETLGTALPIVWGTLPSLYRLGGGKQAVGRAVAKRRKGNRWIESSSLQMVPQLPQPDQGEATEPDQGEVDIHPEPVKPSVSTPRSTMTPARIRSSRKRARGERSSRARESRSTTAGSASRAARSGRERVWRWAGARAGREAIATRAGPARPRSPGRPPTRCSSIGIMARRSFSAHNYAADLHAFT